MKLVDLIENGFEGFPRHRMRFYWGEDLPGQWGMEFISAEQFKNFSKFEVFEEVPLRTWICTDTRVGLNAILWNDEFIALTYQPYRKSDKTWAFMEGWELRMYKAFEKYYPGPDLNEVLDSDDSVFEMDFDPARKYDDITGPIGEEND